MTNAPAGFVASPSFWSEGYHPLDTKELQRLSTALKPGEAIVHWMRGRTDGKRWVWATTESRSVLLGFGWRGGQFEVPHGAVKAVEMQEGAHGHTVRLTTAARLHSLIAVHPPHSAAFVAYVGERNGITPTFIPSKRAGWTPAPRVEARAEAPAVTPPAAPVAATSDDLVARLQALATLRAEGALSEEEFTAAKRRLLGG